MKRTPQAPQAPIKPNLLESYSPKRSEIAKDSIASGNSISKTARTARISRQTVRRIASSMTPDELAQRKSKLVHEAFVTAERAQARINATLDTASTAVANAVYGTAIDKLLALSGQTAPNELHQHLHVHNAEELHARFNEQTRKLIDALNPPNKEKRA